MTGDRQLTALDAFCGEGGTGTGLVRAGFKVHGIDKDPVRLERYPFNAELVEDAVTYIWEHGHEYDLIFAGPTCTGYSAGTRAIPDRLTRYARMIAATREACQHTGKPYVIENVEGARTELSEPVLMCGRMFGLSATDDDGTPLVMDRHRLFESNQFLMSPPHYSHDRELQVAGSYGGARRDKTEARQVRKGGYVPKSIDVQRALLGTPWMSERGCQLSIPPVFSEFLGDQLYASISARSVRTQ